MKAIHGGKAKNDWMTHGFPSAIMEREDGARNSPGPSTSCLQPNDQDQLYKKLVKIIPIGTKSH